MDAEREAGFAHQANDFGALAGQALGQQYLEHMPVAIDKIGRRQSQRQSGERRKIKPRELAPAREAAPAALAPDARVVALPGCDRTMGPRGCAKFRNETNYGGQPTLKGLRNPFGSDPLF